MFPAHSCSGDSGCEFGRIHDEGVLLWLSDVASDG